MKNLIITAVIILTVGVVTSFSQDKINPPKLDNISNSSLINRNNSGFQRGWNWGSKGRALDEALNINSSSRIGG